LQSALCPIPTWVVSDTAHVSALPSLPRRLWHNICGTLDSSYKSLTVRSKKATTLSALLPPTTITAYQLRHGLHVPFNNHILHARSRKKSEAGFKAAASTAARPAEEALARDRRSSRPVFPHTHLFCLAGTQASFCLFLAFFVSTIVDGQRPVPFPPS
jgi:hypothetical protein